MSTDGANGSLWERYRRYLCASPELGFSLDVSRVRFDDDDFIRMSSLISPALDAMERLEAGAIANGDENRMVGHYWLRAPELAPSADLRAAISNTVAFILSVADRFHHRTLGREHQRFKHVIHVGIGGSTTGPQLVCGALKTSKDLATVHFLDNSDPDGIDSVIDLLEGKLGETLVSVVSKCGFTPTPRYVGFELESIFKRSGLDFASHAIATTTEGSDLDRRAVEEGWLERLPMWDWVGGRTSVTSAVGLLPAALQGVDILSLLEGAAAMDRLTRQRDLKKNPAALLAAMWHWMGDGTGRKNMVVLPYKDRLSVLPRYVQQLVMESIGKKHDRNGVLVRQGLTVYGNKGSTDQHSYFQQLRDGANDFFVTFVHTIGGRNRSAVELMPEVTLDDYLFASLEGSRNALYERGRDSITISLPDISARSLGMLIALFERAVCLYAELINVNAYSQPGVDKHVASPIAELQQAVLLHLRDAEPQTAEEIAAKIGRTDQVESIYKLLNRLKEDPKRGVLRENGQPPFEERFSLAR